MSAIIKCYWDKECTQEIFFDILSYSLSLGLKTGLTGDRGEVVHQKSYLKNVGDVTAQNTVVKEVGDLPNYFKMSTRRISYTNLKADIGHLEPGEVTELTLHSIIPRRTPASEGIINYTIEYYTLPGYTAEQEVVEFLNKEHKLEYAGDKNPGNNPAGRPYGYGPYGNPLYGQEGFIHKQINVDTVLPIAGLNYTYINATYSINARYDGTEPSIEDIQSYYTSQYMALACFDGPALPLWLDRYDENE